MPSRSVTSSRGSSERAQTLLPSAVRSQFEPASGTGTGKARKPAVPKTSVLGFDRCRTTSRSPDGRSTARTDRSNGSLAVRLDGAGGVGMVLFANDSGGLAVKRLTKDGPAMQNGMVKVGDTLMSVGGIAIRNMPHDSLHDLVMGEPSSQVRLGLERSDKMTGRTFFYEISLQREEGPSEVPGLGEAAAAAVELELSPSCGGTSGGAWRTLLPTGGEASADYLSAQDSKPRTTDTSNTPFSSLSSLPHSRKLDSESVPSSRQNSARRQEPDSYSRQNSSRRPHAVSPWPTPLSARGLSTAPLDGGEAAFPAELSLALSKSSVDPYSVLGKRNQENIAAMAAEIEMLQGEVATARAEANERKIRAKEADEMAKLEKMKRESEEKLRLDATEREKKVYQQWVDEHEVRKEAEINLEKMTQDHSRAENKVKSLMDENNRLSTEQSQFKAKIAKLENEARESTAKAWTIDDQNKRLTQSLERTQKELTEAKNVNENLLNVTQQLKDTIKKLEAVELKHANRDKSGQLKLNELKEANAKLQETVDKGETLTKKLRADLDALQRKHASATEAMSQKKATIERNNEVERQLVLQVEKAETEIKRLRGLNDMFEKDLEKLRGELESAHTRRKLDKAEISQLRAKLEETIAEVNESSTDCQKERLARSQQDEREKNMQSAILETEARRRDLDSRLWLLEERRKQDLNEFTQLRNDYTSIEAKYAESEARLNDVLRQRDAKTSEIARLQDKITEQVEAMLRRDDEQAATKEQMQANVSTLDAELMRLRKLNNKLENDLLQAQERGRTLDSESGQHKSQFEWLQDKITNFASELEGEKARRLAADERERETRHAFTISQEALHTLEGKFEMTWQEHEILSSQIVKLRQEYAVASAQLKGQNEEIEEAQRLLRDATQMVETEQSRRIAAEDREKLATQNLMTAEMEKREFENRIWLCEERKRQSENALEQVRDSFKNQEVDKKSLMKELKDKTRELEEVKEKSKELASKFQLIGSLKKEFELAERHRSSAEERFSMQEKELEEARELARKTHETCRELSAKSKEDDAEIERLNHEIIALQEKRIASQQEQMSHDRSQESTTKQLRERLREAEEKLQMAEMRCRKAEIHKDEVEAELVGANRRIQSLEHHADALLRQGSIHSSISGTSEVQCGVGGTFQKSGGGFVVTGLDSAPEHMSGTVAPERALRMGDLAIAIDDIPLADMSSIQFRNAIQGSMGTSVSLLIVRRDHASGANLAPVDLILQRRPWIAGDEIALDDSLGQERHHNQQHQDQQQQEYRPQQYHHHAVQPQQQPLQPQQRVDVTTAIGGRAPSPMVRETSPDMAPVLTQQIVERMSVDSVDHSRAPSSASSELPHEALLRTREHGEREMNGVHNSQAVMTQWSSTLEQQPPQLPALAAPHDQIIEQHSGSSQAQPTSAENTSAGHDESELPRAVRRHESSSKQMQGKTTQNAPQLQPQQNGSEHSQLLGQEAAPAIPAANVSPRTNPSFSVKERAAQMQAQYFAVHNAGVTSNPPYLTRKSSSGSSRGTSERSDLGHSSLGKPSTQLERGAQGGDLLTPVRADRARGTSPDDSPLPLPPGW